MNNINNHILSILQSWDINNIYCEYILQFLILTTIFLLSYFITKIIKYIVIPLIHKITARTKITWDNYIFSQHTLEAIAEMVPPAIFYIFLPAVLADEPKLLTVSIKICHIYVIFIVLKIVRSILISLYGLSNEKEYFKNKPIKGIYQMIDLVAIAVGVIIIISIVIGKNPVAILTGLGASAAILMLIFKDSILGLVAGVQLSANDMLRPGDWITIEKYGVDGDVLEITLTTVKVQNFDKTIVTIPPYTLVSESFRNWRGMYNNKGRRIKRSVFIDVNSVHYCCKAELKDLADKGLIDIQKADDMQTAINVSLFRSYLSSFLNTHPRIRHDLITMVRELPLLCSRIADGNLLLYRYYKMGRI